MVHVDVDLDHLIRHSGITQSRPDRRLNAIENQMGMLSHRLRGEFPLAAGRQIRMAASTRDELLAWIGSDHKDDAFYRRSSVYQSDAVLDEAVPVGRIRLLL